MYVCMYVCMCVCVCVCVCGSVGVFGLVLWHVTNCRLFNAKSIFIYIPVLFQTIQFSISTQFKSQKHLYFKLFSLINKVKRFFLVLLCTTNNSIKHQSFF